MTNWIVLMALTRALVVTILNVTGMDYQPVQFFASIDTVQLVSRHSIFYISKDFNLPFFLRMDYQLDYFLIQLERFS